MDEDSDSLLSTLPGPVSSSAMDEATAEDLLTLPGLGSAAGQPRGDIPARRLAGSGGPTVWSEFGELAAETGAVNLGQGFPDWAPPDFVVAEGVRALREGYHQYTRPAGHPPLAEVLAKRYSTHLRRRVDATSEVAVTVGASQALYLTLQALVNPGDEVVLLEPAFDLYYGQVRLAGGVAVGVPLSIDEGEWRLDIDALARVLTPRSKVLVLNSPHNPTGKAFTLEEMRAIADLVRRTPQLLVISDEVYKYTVYDGVHEHFAAVRHLPCPCPHGVHFLAPSRLPSAATQLPEMFDRTVTLSSAGKTFSVTGWQAGWCVGPSRLVRHIQLLLPFVQFCVATPVQQACFPRVPDRPWSLDHTLDCARLSRVSSPPPTSRTRAMRATTTTCASSIATSARSSRRAFGAAGCNRCAATAASF